MSNLYVGLMSGTSLDGVDAALVLFDQQKIQLLDFLTLPMPHSIQASLSELNQQSEIRLKSFCQLQLSVAELFIEASQSLLTQNQLSSTDVQAIGSHGQTIYPAPEIPMSIQIGHPAFIAKRTGIQTIGDFRIDDMANFGQGAPLAPAFHHVLFAQHLPLALVNIGGIANISYLSEQTTIGFDTGPGNGLMDEICQTQLNQPYDFNGDIARNHPISKPLLDKLEQHAYFSLNAPKSTGRETFNLSWFTSLIQDETPEILISTLNQFTVNSIIKGLASLPTTGEFSPKELLVCGGGAFNQTTIDRLKAQLAYPVKTTQTAHELNPNAIEAMMCAWLAKQRLNNQPIALKNITGAKKDSVLGGIWHP